MSDLETTAHDLSKLIISIFRLNGRIIEWGDLLGLPLGLTSARWQILGAIELAGEPQTAPQISRAMGITRQGAQKQLNSMMLSGLIGQKNNPIHERSYLYDLTDQGRTVFRKIQAAYTARLEEVMSGVSSQSLNTAQSVLRSLTLNIEGQAVHKNGKARRPNKGNHNDQSA